MTTNNVTSEIEGIKERLTTLENYVENHVAAKEQVAELEKRVIEYHKETQTDLEEVKGMLRQLLP